MSTPGRHAAARPPRGPSRAVRLAAVGGVMIALLGGGVAFAAWSTSGTGTAGAKASTFAALTVKVGTPAATLYPGATGDASVTITNPNAFAVKVTQIAQDASAGKAVTSTAGASCTDVAGSTHPTGVSFTTTTGAPIVTVAAKATVTTTLTGKVTMSTASDSGCQGATFTIPVTYTATS